VRIIMLWRDYLCGSSTMAAAAVAHGEMKMSQWGKLWDVNQGEWIAYRGCKDSNKWIASNGQLYDG
jgi:hypothetical protein